MKSKADTLTGSSVSAFWLSGIDRSSEKRGKIKGH